MKQAHFQALKSLRAVAVATLFAPLALWGAPPYSSWSDAVPVLDTDNSVQGGCPIETRDGLTIYTASRHEEGSDDNDIWVAHRSSVDEPFGEAEKLPYPVNSDADDFCPTPVGGGMLFFVSTRDHEEACGDGDIYLTRKPPVTGYTDPVNLGCAEDGEGPNTAGGEFSPSLVTADKGVVLYFSTTGYGDMDIYRSRLTAHGTFGVGEPVEELNTEFDDRMPNVSRNGKEIVFSSNRTTWGDGYDPEGAHVSFPVKYTVLN